jgi:hypothetical protein
LDAAVMVQSVAEGLAYVLYRIIIRFFGILLTNAFIVGTPSDQDMRKGQKRFFQKPQTDMPFTGLLFAV